MRRRGLLAGCAAIVLATAGCANTVSGTASKATTGAASAPMTTSTSAAPTSGAGTGTQACELLSATDVASAYRVGGGVEPAEAAPGDAAGIEIRTCRYVYQGIVVAALRTAIAPSAEVGGPSGLLDQVKLSLASSGGDTTAKEESGIGDVAEYLPNLTAKQRTMITAEQRDSDVAFVLVGIAPRDGFDDRAALRTLTRKALTSL